MFVILEVIESFDLEKNIYFVFILIMLLFCEPQLKSLAEN